MFSLPEMLVASCAAGLARTRLVTGDTLQPWEASQMLSLALTKANNADEIQGMIDTY
jgi:hypothetical protein